MAAHFIDGKDAERIRLVTFYVPPEQVLPTSLELAAKLARDSQTAIRATKKFNNNWTRMAGPIFDDSLELEMLTFLGAGSREGLAALKVSLKEKRQQDFPSVRLPT